MDFKINAGVDKFCSTPVHHCYCSIREPAVAFIRTTFEFIEYHRERMQRPWTGSVWFYRIFFKVNEKDQLVQLYIVPRYRVVRTLFTLLFTFIIFQLFSFGTNFVEGSSKSSFSRNNASFARPIRTDHV